jgi:GT2 family glycosyltransferase
VDPSGLSTSFLYPPQVTSLRPQVSVVIPAYGPPEPLLRALERLCAPGELQIEVVVVDNDPERGLGALLPGVPRLRLVEPGWNTGFTGAINLGVKESAGEFVLFHNADLELCESYLPVLVGFMRDHPEAGLCAGKVLRSLPAGGEAARIDTAGIAIRRDRAAHDRGEDQPDAGAFDREEQVFGVSGAALMARRDALDDLAINGDVLDPAFFMYKDDIDLAWRMHLRGWECWYVPGAVAIHARSGRGLGGRGYASSVLAYWRNEGAKAAHVRIHSLKNEWLLLAKYESAWSLLRALPWIASRQAMLTAVTALVAPRSLVRAMRLAKRELPGVRARRKRVFASATADIDEIRRRWVR